MIVHVQSDLDQRLLSVSNVGGFKSEGYSDPNIRFAIREALLTALTQVEGDLGMRTARFPVKLNSHGKLVQAK